MLSTVIFAMAVGRILLGLAPFVAARPTSRLLGFPVDHDTPTARLMARLFGVRDIGLGALVFWALAHREALPFALVFNLFMDAGDLVSAAIPLVRRQGIDRGALSTGACALVGGLSWLVVYSLGA